MTVNWIDETTDEQSVKRRFEVKRNGRLVPGVVWIPPECHGRRPLVLVGHGGSQHKESGAVLDVVGPLTKEHGFVVACIDGPVHGARRADGAFEDPKVILDFRILWNENPGIDEMVEDWIATLDSLLTMPEVDALAVGWFGLSMGTAYGLPFCAADARIRAALLGMWGTSHAHGQRMAAEARKVQCPVLFQRKREDERFTPEGQEELFSAIGSAEKELRVYEGGHVNPAGRQLDDGIEFLLTRLSRPSVP